MHGFVLLPDKLTETQLIELNNTHFDEPLHLDAVSTLPHVTVLQAPIRNGFKATSFLEQFKASSQLQKEPKANLGTLEYVEDHWLFFTVTNPSWLKELNETVVTALDGWIDVEAAPVKTEFANDAQRISYEKTGYRFNLEAYSPHFTVGVSDEPVVLPHVSHLENRRVPFRTLAFCEHGEHGKITRVLETVTLPFSWD